MSTMTRVVLVLGNGREESVTIIDDGSYAEGVAAHGLRSVRVERIVEREEVSLVTTWQAAP